MYFSKSRCLTLLCFALQRLTLQSSKHKLRDLDRISPHLYNIMQTIDENKEKYELWDY